MFGAFSVRFFDTLPISATRVGSPKLLVIGVRREQRTASRKPLALRLQRFVSDRDPKMRPLRRIFGSSLHVSAPDPACFTKRDTAGEFESEPNAVSSAAIRARNRHEKSTSRRRISSVRLRSMGRTEFASSIKRSGEPGVHV